jgi:L-2,4-diaminobutyrate decarboxylase
LNWREPADYIAQAKQWLNSSSDGRSSGDLLSRTEQLVRATLQRGQNLHHPRYIGHQVPASLPLAALFDLVGSATNQVMAIYEMGPWASAVERAVVDLVGAAIGYPAETFAGLCTLGGSLANLTALLTARNVAFPEVWARGVTGDAAKAAIVVQQDVHYSVMRAAGVLGIGTQHVIRVPVDARRKMDVSELERILKQLAAERRPVMAVVAGACATPIGAFDPLDQVASVCREYGVWLHVDAAHGGGLLWSEQHRQRLHGLEMADSVVLDAHKMMFMPALCAFVLYRHRPHQFEAFQQDAPYLFDPSNPGIAEFDSGTRTAECTKRAAALPFWATWSLLGQQFFADVVDVVIDRARQFHGLLEEAPDFDPLHEPECNIQVFRHLPEAVRDWPQERIGQFQLELRRAVITSGDAYLVPIRLDGCGALRATVINPLTTDSDLRAILDIIRKHAQTLLA